MITEELYKEYFSVINAPDNLSRLEYIALQEINKYATKKPAETDEIHEDYLKAIMEQIKFFDENEDIIEVAGRGASLGKFRESNSGIHRTETKLSPMTYAILLNIGLLYSGLC